MQDERQKCAKHARVAMRQARMKSLPAAAAGAAFVVEGLRSIFDLSDDDALKLGQVCTGRATELLMERSINQAAARGASEAELTWLRAYAAELQQHGPEETWTHETEFARWRRPERGV